ncbi:DNA topoisomerase-1 [Bowdeniella nasicola]|uniref:DNA topoisomerase n=1 Tax=Bowdeniella nasicola TaxID=208480 RepID=A0A1H4AAK0_9ACTO|nr:DNA topoisomerase IB [Bowdeniella nasicola]SEA32711.1 DNA topoisomerase-1 [Bowdeniella nasicola]
MTVRRVEQGSGGFTRRRAGKGFTYWGANGKRVTNDKQLQRIKDLVIPPAWDDVWIAASADDHIQATGVDDAGRLQYIYHPEWRAQQDDEKFIRSLAFAEALPSVRRRVTKDLKGSDERARALAAAVRMIDTMGLRVGGSQYAKENESFGASTLQRRHVEVTKSIVHLTFRGKSGGEWDVRVKDAALAEFFDSRPKTPRSALAVCWPEQQGRRRTWHGVSAADINAYLAEASGGHFTAKDFRTWQGTVVAAQALSRAAKAGDTSPEAVTAAIKTTAEWLHNTPAIARDSYINPRVIELFEKGTVISGKATDAKVRALLT